MHICRTVAGYSEVILLAEIIYTHQRYTEAHHRRNSQQHVVTQKNNQQLSTISHLLNQFDRHLIEEYQ